MFLSFNLKAMSAIGAIITAFCILSTLLAMPGEVIHPVTNHTNTNTNTNTQ